MEKQTREEALKYKRDWARSHSKNNNTNSKKWYEENKELHYQWVLKYAQDNPQRHNAQNYAGIAFPEAQPCEINGCQELGQRHHDNYDEPLEIRWLCCKHHKELHRKYQ